MIWRAVSLAPRGRALAPRSLEIAPRAWLQRVRAPTLGLFAAAIGHAPVPPHPPPFSNLEQNMIQHRWLPLAGLTVATLALACSHGGSTSSSMGMGGMEASPSPALASMGKGY